jgi:hypothetical protein
VRAFVAVTAERRPRSVRTRVRTPIEWLLEAPLDQGSTLRTNCPFGPVLWLFPRRFTSGSQGAPASTERDFRFNLGSSEELILIGCWVSIQAVYRQFTGIIQARRASVLPV